MPLLNFLSRFRFSTQLHWPWLAGLVLLCFAATVSLTKVPELRLQTDMLAHQAQALEAQLRAPAALGMTEHAPDVLAQLATLERLPVIVGDLQTMAAKNGLTLADASYKPIDDKAGAELGRVEIGARLTGTYLPLKKTIAALLAAHEGLALQSLALRRNRSTDAAMDIELRFSLYYRKPA